MPNDGGTVVRTTLTTVSNGRNLGVAMALIAAACCATSAVAQQGHPLVGSWPVRLEAAPSADNGGTRYLIEGQIENLGSITERSIVGTWLQGERHGNFRVVMN